MIIELLDYLGNVIGHMEVPPGTSPEAIQAIRDRFAAPPAPAPEPVVTSFSVDKAEENQFVETTEWVKVDSKRVLWDVDSGIDVDTSVLTVQKSGVYNYDFQMRVESLVNIKAIEVALFRIIDGDPDDYWFTLGREQCTDMSEPMLLGGMTQFDFYVGEQYYLAIRLRPLSALAPVSAEISGSDDHTAWGASYSTPLKNSYRE